MMNMYQAFATDLNHLPSSARAVRTTVPEYMPLLVEETGVTKDGHRLVSLCQYDEQHGNLMRDCDLVFMVTDLPTAWQPNRCHFRTTTRGSFKKSIDMTRRADRTLNR